MKHKKIKYSLITLITLIIIIIIAFVIYTEDYYRADNTALNIINNSNVSLKDNLTIIYPPGSLNKNIGLIFYPGGKVEDKAYLPLLNKLANQGITIFLVKMPFNLAVFNTNAANKIINNYPSINSWYLAGHSLGGAMASSYVEKNYTKLKGLILLAAYPINDADIKTITIYGSNDGVLDKTKLKDIKNLIEINGGNHAYFGNYGEQNGDGIATITREKQQEITVENIMNFILE